MIKLAQITTTGVAQINTHTQTTQTVNKN